MTLTDWTTPRRLAQLFGGTIGFFAALSLASVALSRVAQVAPGTRWLSPDAFGQVLGLHHVLLHTFVLLPVIPSVFGYAWVPTALGQRNVALPRLAALSWLCLLAGGVLILQSVATNSVEPGWAYAVASPLTRDLVSQTFLAGLALGTLSLLLTSVVLLVTIARAHNVRRSMFLRALSYASGLALPTSLLTLAALALAWLEKITPLPQFSTELGGDPTLLPQVAAFASTPAQAGVLLSAVGLACAVLRPDDALPTRALRAVGWQLFAVALLSLPALNTRILPATLPAQQLVVAFMLKALFTTALIALVTTIVRAATWQRWWEAPGPIAAVSALVLIVLVAPLELFLSAPGAAVFARGYFDQGCYYLLLGGSSLLVILGGVSHILGGRADGAPDHTLFIVATAVIQLGLLGTVVPMFVMGTSGIRMEMTDFPPEFVPLQTFVLFGGGILVIGMILATAALAARATRLSVRPFAG